MSVAVEARRREPRSRRPGTVDAAARAPVIRERAGPRTEPRAAATMIDVLEARAREDPGHVHLTLLDDPAPATSTGCC